jgi:hypothetical protein
VSEHKIVGDEEWGTNGIKERKVREIVCIVDQ